MKRNSKLIIRKFMCECIWVVAVRYMICRNIFTECERVKGRGLKNEGWDISNKFKMKKNNWTILIRGMPENISSLASNKNSSRTWLYSSITSLLRSGYHSPQKVEFIVNDNWHVDF